MNGVSKYWVQRQVGMFLTYAGIIAALLFFLMPFAWIVTTSLKGNAELYDPKANPLWIRHPSLDHYVGLLRESNFLLWIGNTMLVATI